jgi:hypothetical protein
MYPWNASAVRQDAGHDEDGPDVASTDPGPGIEPIQAVQVALDRRDNGGQATRTPALTRQ